MSEEQQTKTVFGRQVQVNPDQKTPAEIKDAEFQKAVWQSMGNMSALAKLLNVDYNSLYKYIHTPKHEDRLQLIKLAKSQLVDIAENYIKNAFNDENIDSRTKVDIAKFILKTLGKDTYSENPAVSQQININSDFTDIKTIFGI